MEQRAPTLSPTPLITLPQDPNENSSPLDSTIDLILGSEKEIQPSLHAFNQLLASNKVQESLNRDIQSLLMGSETFIGEMNDEDFSYLDPMSQMPMPYPYLRNAGRTEGARLIKNNRILDLKKFGKPSFAREEPGFDLAPSDPDLILTTSEKEYLKHLKIQLCDKFFFKVGAANPCIGLGSWLGLAYQDWFDVDDITCEIRRAGNGLPLGLHLMDPALIKPILPRAQTKGASTNVRWDVFESKDVLEKIKSVNPKLGFTNNEVKDPEDLYTFLFYKDNKRLAKYTNYKMFKAHFFQTTDYRYGYRGSSVVQQGLRMITNISNSIMYNASNFDNNRTPAGILAFQGGFTNRTLLQNYRTMLYSYLSNANNRHRVPMFGLPQGGDMKWVPFGGSNRDMEYNLFITLLFTILAKLSGTSPEEVGLSSYENAMRGSQPFDKSPDGVLQISRDKGMNSFLYHIEDTLNSTGVFQQITKMRIKVRFNGLVVEDKQVKINWDSNRLTVDSSLNDMLREKGEEPATMMSGDINIYDVKAPNNALVQQTIAANAQKAQQEKAERQQAIQAQQEALNQAGQQGGGEGGQEEEGQQGGTKNQPEQEGEDQQQPEDQNLVKQYGEPQQ